MSIPNRDTYITLNYGLHLHYKYIVYAIWHQQN